MKSTISDRLEWLKLFDNTQDPSDGGVRAVAVQAHQGKPPRELLVREGDLVLPG